MFDFLCKYRLLIENIFSLGSIKGIEYILQFVTFPYLVRILGMTSFGNIAFAQGIVQYFVLFTDYGFNLFGPKEIAKHDDESIRGIFFANIFWSKVFLLCIASVIFLCCCWIFYKFNLCDVILLLIIYINVIGNVLFPVWFFQGIQQMRYITIVSVVARSISVCGIFWFVQSPADYLWAGFFQSIPPLLAGFFSWYILWKKFPETLCFPSIGGIKNCLKDAWAIFISTVAINIYTTSNTVILGLMTNATVVGYFSSAYKIINCVQMGMAPIIHAVYPYVNKLISINRKEALSFIKKVLYIFGGINFIVFIILFYFSGKIIGLLFGFPYNESVLMLRVLSILPFIIALSNVLGIQTMLPLGMQSIFSKIIVSSAIINTILVFPMIFFLGGIGTCIAMVFTECFVTITMAIILKRKKILL